jgi:hypothetical protein
MLPPLWRLDSITLTSAVETTTRFVTDLHIMPSKMYMMYPGQLGWLKACIALVKGLLASKLWRQYPHRSDQEQAGEVRFPTLHLTSVAAEVVKAAAGYLGSFRDASTEKSLVLWLPVAGKLDDAVGTFIENLSRLLAILSDFSAIKHLIIETEVANQSRLK